MCGAYLIDGAGHWLEPEQPEQVSGLLIQFPTAQAVPVTEMAAATLRWRPSTTSK
jgi:hypothetical protein